MDNTTQDSQDIELLVDNLRYHLGAEAVGNEYSFYERDKAIEIIEAYVTTRVKEAELSRFEYDDWEVGDDNKLRLGDFINCNHQRGFDGYEQNFEGQIIEHHGNGMPVVIYNVDPKDPDNSGDYATLQDMYMQGWTFSRIKSLTTTTNGEGE